MKRLFFLSLLVTLAMAVSAQEYRDVVYLKNGSVIKGFYKSFFMNDTLRMETLDGSTLVCPVSDILRIAKEKTDVYVVQQDESAFDRKWRPRGYSGSVEILTGWCGDDNTLSSEGLYTTHGYRFNQHLFLGLGVGVERYYVTAHEMTIQQNRCSIPLYGEGRWYVTHTRIAPYVICRGGYTFYGLKGGFISPGLGADFSITPHIGCFMNLMYRWQKYTYDWQLSEMDEDGLSSTYINTSFLLVSVGLRF